MIWSLFCTEMCPIKKSLQVTIHVWGSGVKCAWHLTLKLLFLGGFQSNVPCYTQKMSQETNISANPYLVWPFRLHLPESKCVGKKRKQISRFAGANVKSWASRETRLHCALHCIAWMNETRTVLQKYGLPCQVPLGWQSRTGSVGLCLPPCRRLICFRGCLNLSSMMTEIFLCWRPFGSRTGPASNCSQTCHDFQVIFRPMVDHNIVFVSLGSRRVHSFWRLHFFNWHYALHYTPPVRSTTT